MLHEPAAPPRKDPAAPYKSRLGLRLFAIYAVLYGGFVGLNLYDASLMEIKVALGLNLATIYGFLLIVFAVLEALLYDRACSKRESALGSEEAR